MPRYQFSIKFGHQSPSHLKTVELRDESRALAAGKRVADVVAVRLQGNKQLANATLIVSDAGGLVVCEFPFSGDLASALKSLGMLD
ncbi:hypothetical protein [Methylobacterium soli]|uniref:Uncharacterized protein n=1 Tax=Methylobacterium soli TaxID=553447 RepID=A0A6L3SUG3_9HYPH|nr:hypothetical protein [Methylobacterium soli]KAB1077102.1 hypothetical protein F6X53_20750 [Methylobacterium soli]GJE46945.1 hypothetical protein AEGHOMDF_6154 [Methylobacterium soli]